MHASKTPLVVKAQQSRLAFKSVFFLDIKVMFKVMLLLGLNDIIRNTISNFPVISYRFFFSTLYSK